MTQSRTALVVGATGVIGRALCKTLVNDAWRVWGVARFRNEARRDQLAHASVEPIVFDVKTDDPARLPEVSALFLEIWDRRHISGEHLEDCWSLNFDAVGRIVRRYAGVADVINGSTGSLYGPRADRPSRETDPPHPMPGRPDLAYAQSRLAQEQLINFLCVGTPSRVFHLRYYRANSRTRGTIHSMAERILRNRSLGDRPDERIQVMGLADFVRCTVLAVNRLQENPQAVNIVHPRIWTIRELANHIQRELGKGQVIFDSDSGGGDQSIWGDPSRMIQIFGEPLDDLDELIRHICDHARHAARST